MIFLNDVKQIDLTKHGLIEASAGTGKTYTIENLVVRMMCECKIPLEQILIVTFTDPATEELKERIRSKMEDKIQTEQDVDVLNVLLTSLDNFDQASISTIHSFCRSLIKDFSFELGGSFQSSLASEEELISEAFDVVLRKFWPKMIGENLPLVLKWVSFNESRFRDQVLDACKKMHLHELYALYPEPNIDKIHSSIRNLQKLALEMIQVCDESSYHFDQGSLDVINKVVKKEGAVNFYENTLEIKKYLEIEDYPFRIAPLIPFEFKKNAKPEAERSVQKLFSKYEEIFEEINVLRCTLISVTVFEILREIEQKKAENNLISFADMLIKAERLICGSEENQKILTKLQSRYLFALIDEFQDTDILQWNTFNTLFLGSPNSKIFLIGDPKQSIYRFRNADIHTYLSAKEKISQLQARGLAEIYSLQVNYRSLKPLINDFNLFFAEASWFGMSEEVGKINYQKAVGFHDSAKDLSCYSVRQSGLKLLQLQKRLELLDSKKISVDVYLNVYYDLIVEEILYLKQSNSHIEFSDFCCLFDTRSKMIKLKDKFTKAGIPYSEFKEGGISESVEALELLYVLQALRNPHYMPTRSIAFMTMFFRVDPHEIKQFEELPLQHPLLITLLAWQQLALRRQWYKLFNELMENSGVINYCLTQDDGERKIANFRQIIEWLLIRIDQNKLDLEGVCHEIKGYRIKESALTNEENYFTVASEQKKVQLLTIHASKGLEFKYVFLCKYKSKRVKSNEVFWVRDDNKIRVVLDDSNEGFTKREEKEQDLESKRLMYVAFTRAIHSLYLPFSSEYTDPFYADIIAPILQNNLDTFEQIDFAVSVPQRFQIPVESKAKPDRVIVNNGVHLALPELHPQILFPSFFVQSYSSIAAAEIALTDLLVDEKWDEDFSKADDESVLPKGANTGNLFHHIFENISFDLVYQFYKADDSLKLFKQDEAILKLFRSSFALYSFDMIWLDKAMELVYQVLTNPISLLDDDFVLASLSQQKRLHEMEFYYSVPAEKGKQFFLKGFIDMLFQYKGKYYILDWKSNYLDEGYEQASLTKAMIDHQYDLQYKVYTVCLYEWLTKKGMKPKEWGSVFGGVLYYFIRGAEYQQGCFFNSSLDLSNIESIQKEISKLMQTMYHRNHHYIFDYFRE